jgi:predicted 3-demethylubiquinone-9 3-methyltransferase (glyoxalase superfamily)
MTVRIRPFLMFQGKAGEAMAFYASPFVECESADWIDRFSAPLSDGGTIRMPLGECGFSQRCAWMGDRYGVSWRLNLA